MKKIDLVEKKFDPELKTLLESTSNFNDIFLNTYIKENFDNDLHFLPFILVELVIFSTNSMLLIYDFNKEKYFPSTDIFLDRFKNTRKRFTFFPVTLRFEGGSEYSISALYDKVTNEVEIFDSLVGYTKPYEKNLKNFFHEIYGKQIKIIYLTKCSFFGEFFWEKCFDKDYDYNPKSFCVIWVLWYLELRLKNRDLDRKLTIDLAIKKLKKSKSRLCKLLRGYTQFVESEVSKYDLIEKNGKITIKPKTKSRFTKKELFNVFTVFVGVLGYIAGRLAFEKYRKNLISSKKNNL